MPHPLGALLKSCCRDIRLRVIPLRFWRSSASKPITLLLAIAPPNGMADLRERERGRKKPILTLKVR